MQTIVGVRFKKAGRIYYFSPGRLELAKGDHVIVETARGMEYGVVVIGPREVEDSEVTPPLKIVQRKASQADQEKMAENQRRQQEAFELCGKKIAEHGLAMKLVDVEYTFDVNKIVFYFTADGRIDFRELVKDLAAIFRTRIELRQIGVRDEAKLMGGIGCCGRPLCCASFLGDFEPVSIRMAKEQNLSLNPTKISGICGRLMCCLKYENDCYADRCPRKKIQPPSQGSKVVSVEGEGKVISLNVQRRTATILLDDGKTIVASWEDVVEKDEDSMAGSGELSGEPGEAVLDMESEGARAGKEEGANEDSRPAHRGKGKRDRRTKNRAERRNEADKGAPEEKPAFSERKHRDGRSAHGRDSRKRRSHRERDSREAREGKENRSHRQNAEAQSVKHDNGGRRAPHPGEGGHEAG